jgi:hypothetical protein
MTQCGHGRPLTDPPAQHGCEHGAGRGRSWAAAAAEAARPISPPADGRRLRPAAARRRTRNARMRRGKTRLRSGKDLALTADTCAGTTRRAPLEPTA